jgi:hypothetical protein
MYLIQPFPFSFISQVLEKISSTPQKLAMEVHNRMFGYMLASCALESPEISRLRKESSVTELISVALAMLFYDTPALYHHLPAIQLPRKAFKLGALKVRIKDHFTKDFWSDTETVSTLEPPHGITRYFLIE